MFKSELIRSDLEYITKKLIDSNYYFEGQTILLAGSNGLLGSFFQQYFAYLNQNVLKEKCTLVCVDHGFFEPIQTYFTDPNIIYINHNLILPIGAAFRYKFNYIINCAGIASPTRYEQEPVMTMDISYIGTKHLLDFAYQHGVKAYLGFSSSEIYGNPPDLFIPTDEQYLGSVRTIGARAPYDIGKLILETLCHVYSVKYGVNTKIVRPFNVFGYMKKTDGRVIPNFFNSLLKNEKIKIYGNGEQTRTYCWFSDFIIGAILVLLHGNNFPFNIGNSTNEISVAQLAYKIQELLNKRDMIEFVSTPYEYKNEPTRRCPNISLARKQVGYYPEISLEEGLEKFHKHFSL